MAKKKQPPELLPLADWRNEKKYPPANTPMEEWAWAFLRRNPAYWWWWYRVPEGIDSYQVPQGKGAYLILAKDQQSPWELHFHPRPDIVKPLVPIELVGSYGPVHEGEQLAVPFGKMAFIFDLELPTKEQIKRAEAALACEMRSAKLASEIRRPSDNLWAKYLRLLDGDRAGATHKEMAKILFPPERESSNGPYPDESDALILSTAQGANKTDQENRSLKHVENGLKAARQLCDGGWRRIAAAANVPRPKFRQRGMRPKGGKGHNH